MAKVTNIFFNIEKITLEDGQNQFLSSYIIDDENDCQQNICYDKQKTLIKEIINEIDELSTEIQNDSTILISVKNQKLLRTCYQIITSIGFSQSLLPGLGINLSKRCLSAKLLDSVNFSDEQKYDMLTECADFFTRSYAIPVLKKIILTLHLSDYLAAVIQLSFAPIKKPGTYDNFVMTCELYEKLLKDRLKYVQTYEYLVANCFQPTLMKELLVLQGVKEPSPPMFVKRVVAKEMSRRLLAPGGLLSLIRCFMESYDTDIGFDWRKIDMICKILSSKHGTDTEASYLNNICSQLAQILTFNNTHYLTTAVACIISINEKFPEAGPVKELIREVFQAFDYNDLISKSNLPGTILLSPQEVEHNINILNALCSSKVDCPPSLLLPNIYVLFLLGMKCYKNEELKIKLKDILLKCFELVKDNDVALIFKDCLMGKDRSNLPLQIEEYDAGLAIKYIKTQNIYLKEDALVYFLNLLKCCSDNNFVQKIFELSLSVLINLNIERKQSNKEILSIEDEPTIFNEVDEQYITVLQLLSELSTSPKILASLKNNPTTVLNFVEHFIMSNQNKSDEECVTVALVLLNTILANSQQSGNLKKRFEQLIPVLSSMSQDESSINNILCTEALSLIMTGPGKAKQGPKTEFQEAISDVFDSLLPVRAHGMIVLTKLIDNKDLETISKKHYVFCVFQEYLKDTDTYIYLAAINGIASLGTHCPEDVLHVLCKEFLQTSITETNAETKTDQNKIAELRMKIGDAIVKVTKRLGEMAIVHKTVLLNTVLSGCRDEDPLIRTSALSNLAEICLVLHYKMGSIIYEVLLCIWSILESDKAIECRRAAVMVISSLIKGLGKDVLIQLKDNLLPIYETLKTIYNNDDEDSVLRIHAQIALGELNDIVKQFLFPELKIEKEIFVLDKPSEIFK